MKMFSPNDIVARAWKSRTVHALLASTVLMPLCPTLAFAQSNTGAQASAVPSEARSNDSPSDIVVTATRLGRRDIPTPMLTIAPETLREGARPTVAAILNDLPQFRTTQAPTTTGTSIFAGTSAVDLRGLGTNRTLMLVDGKRFVTSFTNPDIGVLPSVLVRRIDVVTSSASAAWGSNAVAGVVNVILEDRIEGVRLGAQTGISSRGDVAERRFDGAIGTSFANGRGNAYIGGEYVDNDGARPRTSRPNVGRWAVVSNPTFTTTNGQQPLILAPDVGLATESRGGLILSGVNAGLSFNPDGTLSPFNRGRVVGPQSIGGDAPAADDVAYLSAPSRRYSLIGRMTYDLTNAIKITADIRHARIFDNYPWLPDDNRGNITIRSDNAFLPAAIRNQMAAAGQTSFTFGRFNDDFALINIDYSRRITEASIGIDADLGGTFKATGYLSHGLLNEDVDLSHSRITSNFNLAVDAVVNPATGQIVCRTALTNPTTNCVPINLFGVGNTSEASRNYVLGTAMQRQRLTLDAGAFTIRGEPIELPAGPVSVALGVEGRHQVYRQRVGALDATSSFAFFNYSPIYGKNTTKEAFGELLIPLIHDTPLLQRLQINGAVRITNDRTGSIWSWKAGLTDEVTDGLTLRATLSRDIRAPNLDEQFAGSVVNITNIFDSARGQTYPVRFFSGGNPNLRPEASRSFTVGGTFTPRFLRNLRLSVDYFNIRIHDAIATLAANDVISLCNQGNQSLCSAVVRDSSGLITQVSASQINFARIQTRGIDFDLGYSFRLGGTGAITLRSTATWVQKLEVNNGLSVQDFVRSQGITRPAGVPSVRINSSIGYSDGSSQFYLRNRYISPGVYNIAQAIQNNAIPAYVYFDLGLSHTIRTGTRGSVELYLNVNNVLDRDPPVASQLSPFYDVIGRYMSVGVRMRL